MCVSLRQNMHVYVYIYIVYVFVCHVGVCASTFASLCVRAYPRRCHVFATFVLQPFLSVLPRTKVHCTGSVTLTRPTSLVNHDQGTWGPLSPVVPPLRPGPFASTFLSLLASLGDVRRPSLRSGACSSTFCRPCRTTSRPALPGPPARSSSRPWSSRTPSLCAGTPPPPSRPSVFLGILELA